MRLDPIRSHGLVSKDLYNRIARPGAGGRPTPVPLGSSRRLLARRGIGRRAKSSHSSGPQQTAQTPRRILDRLRQLCDSLRQLLDRFVAILMFPLLPDLSHLAADLSLVTERSATLNDVVRRQVSLWFATGLLRPHSPTKLEQQKRHIEIQPIRPPDLTRLAPSLAGPRPRRLSPAFALAASALP